MAREDWGAERACIRVQEIAGKGFGVVAVRRIQRGEVVLDAADDLLLSLEYKPGIEPGRSEITKAFENLSDADKLRFMELGDKYASADDQKTVYGIFFTNVFGVRSKSGLATGTHHVYHKISRFNHSCDPHAAWHCRKMVAIKEIEAGEEICFSYVKWRVYWTTIAERRAFLKSWKFDCQWPACSLADCQGSAAAARSGAETIL